MYLYDCCYTIIHAGSHLVSNIKWFGVVCCLQPKFQKHFRDSQQHTMEVVRHNPLHQIKWRMNSQNWYTFVPHDLQTIETLQYNCMNISNLTLLYTACHPNVPNCPLNLTVLPSTVASFIVACTLLLTILEDEYGHTRSGVVPTVLSPLSSHIQHE